MASMTLYPPIIASNVPAFLAGTGDVTLKVPISFSKFNNLSDFVCAHISVSKKDTGMSVVNTEDDIGEGRYRATGIIINVPVMSSTDDEGKVTYYVEIKGSDLKSQVFGNQGWIPGWYYKIQVRLSAANFPGGDQQQAWLNANASNFSEWSTVCIAKAIGNIRVQATNFDYSYDASVPYVGEEQIFGNTLAFYGKYSCEDTTELLSSYRVKLFNYPRIEEDEPIEDSGYKYNTATDINEFNYTFKTMPEQLNSRYIIEVEYETLNNYADKFEIDFSLTTPVLDRIGARIVTIENDSYHILDGITTLDQEEDEGRIGLKLFAAEAAPYSGNLIIRRSSSADNFKTWEDIKVVTFKNQAVKDYPIFYDYTIESGVWYKYGVQSINAKGQRSEMNATLPLLRNFHYTYLLGEDGKQLKLMYDTKIDQYKTVQDESFTNTIGGKYAVFSRNSAVGYRNFGMNGLISFWMDEQNTFTNKHIVYEDDYIKDLYDQYNLDNNIMQYDYIYEREFREMVMDFLYNGKPKLYKSATEGNMIVRLTNTSFSPKAQLDRMIYDFSTQVYELDDFTVDNCKKYGWIILDDVETDFAITNIKLGQLVGDFLPTDNIFELIRQKYCHENILGHTIDIGRIRSIKITIEHIPMKIVDNAGKEVLGYNIELKDRKITLNSFNNTYFTHDKIWFDSHDTLYILNDMDNIEAQIPAIIDFIYEEKAVDYIPKQVSSILIKEGFGQIYGYYSPNTSLYDLVKTKYLIEWENQYRHLHKINGVEIEALPGATFQIQDESEDIGDIHVVGETGVLEIGNIANIIEVRYIGLKNFTTGKMDTKTPISIMMNYTYVTSQGGYQNG